MTSLNPELEGNAFEELEETPELRSSKLEELRHELNSLSIEDQPENQSDENLLRFLRVRKYDIPRALKTILSHKKFERDHPEWASDLAAEEFAVFDGYFQVLERPDSYGRLIVVLCPKLGLPVFTRSFLATNPHALIRSNIWFLNTISKNLNAQINGVVVIQSYSNLTITDNLTLARIASLSEQYAIIQYIEQCIGLRLKAVVIIDAPVIIRMLLNLIRSVMSKKLRDRFYFCSSEKNSIQELISDTSMIPIRFGGSLEDDGGYNWLQEQIKKEKSLS